MSSLIFRWARSREDGLRHPVRRRCATTASLSSPRSATGPPGVWLLVDMPRETRWEAACLYCVCVTWWKEVLTSLICMKSGRVYRDILHIAVSTVHMLHSAAPRLPPATHPVIYWPQSEFRIRVCVCGGGSCHVFCCFFEFGSVRLRGSILGIRHQYRDWKTCTYR